ncbi:MULTISPECIES: hypothetical protein [Microbacterium]|uniref:hypothetical protein n=1 Tax=Microbacterium TaxID=33882 RepID=UPI0027809493|nr:MULTISPECIES: hypothetical protein [Microbacterium]MDQ1082840.1 hypothetical protein [Microbacterium sp. SORGH_AS_0344]MDQ1168391.1 hypothetical protein [Microbacterium proteolyticum]
MAHTSSTDRAGTVVAVVGESSADALAAFEGLPGVATLSLRDSEPGLAARRIGAARSPWVVHDADPLVHVASAWVELYEERATLGTLEAEVDNALDSFQRGDAIMPDYYVVLDPDTADTTWRHWWCGALGHRAPRRVLPAQAPANPRDRALRALLTALPTSRPWPDPTAWLPGLAFEVPDRVGLRDRGVA